MTNREFDELVGAEVEGPERERLHGVHDLLLAAGPPPELPPSLALPPGPERDEAVRVLRSTYPRRRLVAAVALAAALALAAFGGGYLLGDRGREEAAGDATRLVRMVGTDLSPGARASLRLFAADEDGNRTIELTVRGVKTLAGRGYYELGLTRRGELVAPCGTFNVAGDKTVVTFDVPYDWKRFDGWAIVAHEEPDLGEASEFLLTTET